jgi:hypothetical protein
MTARRSRRASGRMANRTGRVNRWAITSAALLIALVGLIAWVALAPRLVADGSSKGSLPLSEVARSVRSTSRSEGNVKAVRCHVAGRNAWNCSVYFVDKRIVIVRAVWYQSQKTVGVSVLRRISP